jgi:hypothetical protein
MNPKKDIEPDPFPGTVMNDVSSGRGTQVIYYAGTFKINPTPKTFSMLKSGSSPRYLRILVMNTSRLLPKK